MPPAPPHDETIADTLPRRGMNGTPAGAGLRNMQQLIELRWIAVFGQVITIMLVHHGLEIELPIHAMLLVVTGLAAFNHLSLLYWRHKTRVTDTALLVGLLVDVASLTAQLYLSGGITNPFAFLYLLQVALGAVLLRPLSSWIVVAATGLALTALTLAGSPTELPVRAGSGLAPSYLLGLLLCFVMIAILLVVFITRIGGIIRERDARVAELRQRAAEEDHIVRIGLLASGAAHELGTPLSTLSVILGDWRHLPTFASDPELLNDVAEMQGQVERCKSIVTNILLSAGETRGDAPVETTLHAFLDGLVSDWRTSRASGNLAYRNDCSENPGIVADTGLQQMMFNVLDNALEVSPDRVELHARVDGANLVIDVSDDGPGFAPAILERLGTPYNSSKGRPGGGLGLFLSVNVARTLGGRLTARNRPEGGAIVTVTLPLSALSIEEREDDE